MQLIRYSNEDALSSDYPISISSVSGIGNVQCDSSPCSRIDSISSYVNTERASCC